MLYSEDSVDERSGFMNNSGLKGNVEVFGYHTVCSATVI